MSRVCLWITSNCDSRRAAWVEEKVAEFPGISRVFASARIGHAKPDRAVYDHVIAEMGRPAGEMYLIDEGMPSSTDVEFNRKAGEILKERLATTTVVIVSHQPQTLEKFARSAAVLKNGKLHMFDTLEEARQLYDYETQG